MRNCLIFNLLLALALSSCRPSSGEGKAVEDREPTPNSPNPAAEAYPPVPDSIMQQVWERCDYIDFIFYHLNFSLSQDQQSDIRKSVEHIAASAPVLQAQCQPVGRVFYQIEGKNVLEGDIYFSPECQYFVFYQKGKKVYANTMTPAGIQYYERVFSMSN